jgi:hypothetical protein
MVFGFRFAALLGRGDLCSLGFLHCADVIAVGLLAPAEAVEHRAAPLSHDQVGPLQHVEVTANRFL